MMPYRLVEEYGHNETPSIVIIVALQIPGAISISKLLLVGQLCTPPVCTLPTMPKCPWLTLTHGIAR